MLSRQSRTRQPTAQWQPYVAAATDTKKYKCSRCGEPKQGHVCKMLLTTESRGAQAEPGYVPRLTGQEKTITVTATKKGHRRQQSDPFPLFSSSDVGGLPEFGLPEFQLVSDPKAFELDELFSSFSCAETSFDFDEDVPPPPPTETPDPYRSPRTPFFEGGARSPQSRPSSGNWGLWEQKSPKSRPSSGNYGQRPTSGNYGRPTSGNYGARGFYQGQSRQNAYRSGADVPQGRPMSIERKKSHRRINSEPFASPDPVALAAALFGGGGGGPMPPPAPRDPFLPRLSDASTDSAIVENHFRDDTAAFVQ